MLAELFDFAVYNYYQITLTPGRTVYGEPAVGDDAISYAECNQGEVVMR